MCIRDRVGVLWFPKATWRHPTSCAHVRRCLKRPLYLSACYITPLSTVNERERKKSYGTINIQSYTVQNIRTNKEKKYTVQYTVCARSFLCVCQRINLNIIDVHEYTVNIWKKPIQSTCINTRFDIRPTLGTPYVSITKYLHIYMLSSLVASCQHSRVCTAVIPVIPPLLYSKLLLRSAMCFGGMGG